MRITKEKAHAIAEILASKKHKEVKAIMAEISQLCYDEYLSQLPEDVVALSKKHPEYFNISTYAWLDGHGLNRYSVYFKEGLPKNTYNYCTINISASFGSKIQKLKEKHERALSEWEALKKDLEVALIACRTFSVIEKNLPEAIPFFPKSENRDLMVNFTDLRKKIK